MKYLRWIYHRTGQMFCFAAGVALIGNDGGEWQKTIGGAALLLAGLGLKALHIWQQNIDPSRE